MKISILKHPAAILCGAAIGVAVGLFNAKLSAFFGIGNFARFLSFPGELYIFFLYIAVIPVIITAVSASLGKLVRNRSGGRQFRRIITIFALSVVVCTVIGMAAGIIGKPGIGLGEDTRTLFAELFSASKQSGADGGILEVTLGSNDNADTARHANNIASFFINTVSTNIFQALALGSVIAILVFSVSFGAAIGFLPNDSAALLVNFCTAIFQTFQKVIDWSLYLLPFALICLMAGQSAAVGVQVFWAMSKFITAYCAVSVIVFAAGTAIIWCRSGIRSPLKVISMLFEPILLAFATRNSTTVLPSAINCLENKMGFNPVTVNLALPLGITLGRFGNICYFALAVFFIAQVYNTSFEPIHYLIIFAGVIFAGTATAGASGIAILSMLNIVLDPLSLPKEAVLVIFIAIDPIIAPFRTFLDVYINISATTITSEKPFL